MKLSIIIPAYNEESRIYDFASSLIDYSFKELKRIVGEHEIIFVNDGSVDKTLEIIEKIKSSSKNGNIVRILSYPINKGKGYAVRRGILNSSGEKVLFIDADGSIVPEEIPKMIEKLEKYDVVIGDRYSKESHIEQPSHRIITGTVFSKIANLIFPINTVDTLCGFKGFKRDAADKLFKELISEGWVFDVELIYRAQKNNYTIYKLPFKWVHKKGTKMKFSAPIKMVWDLTKLRFKMKYGK